MNTSSKLQKKYLQIKKKYLNYKARLLKTKNFWLKNNSLSQEEKNKANKFDI